jgi:hypothetical protein
MRRRDLAIALVVSLLLHAVLILLVWREPVTRRAPVERAGQAPVEIEIAQLAPPKPTPEKPSATPPARGEAERKRAEVPSREKKEIGTATPPAIPSAPPPEEKGMETARPPLGPRDSVLGVPAPPGEAPGGTTVRPGDPSLSESARRTEEEARVKERVDAWAEDAAAESRAQRGLPHPYLVQLGEALRATLDSAPGGTPAALGAPDAAAFLLNSYLNAAQEYGKTGKSDVTVPGPSPHQTEKQKELFGDDAQWLRAYTQAAETIQNMSNGAPLLSLTLELRQTPNGRLLSQKIVQRSSSAKFDAFVLRVVPEALARLGPVPEPALRGRDELKSVWRIDGWPRLPKNVERWTSLIGTPAAMGIPADPLLKQLAASQHFAFRPRLLRAY